MVDSIGHAPLTSWGTCKESAINGQAVNEARLLASMLPLSEASAGQLRERVQSTIHAENQAAAVLAEALMELRRRGGTELVETVLREDGLLSRRRARSEVDTAVEVKELPHASEGLRRGEISYDNARIIAGARFRRARLVREANP